MLILNTRILDIMNTLRQTQFIMAFQRLFQPQQQRLHVQQQAVS